MKKLVLFFLLLSLTGCNLSPLPSIEREEYHTVDQLLETFTNSGHNIKEASVYQLFYTDQCKGLILSNQEDGLTIYLLDEKGIMKQEFIAGEKIELIATSQEQWTCYEDTCKNWTSYFYKCDHRLYQLQINFDQHYSIQVQEIGNADTVDEEYIQNLFLSINPDRKIKETILLEPYNEYYGIITYKEGDHECYGMIKKYTIEGGGWIDGYIPGSFKQNENIITFETKNEDEIQTHTIEFHSNGSTSFG